MLMIQIHSIRKKMIYEKQMFQRYNPKLLNEIDEQKWKGFGQRDPDPVKEANKKRGKCFWR